MSIDYCNPLPNEPLRQPDKAYTADELSDVEVRAIALRDDILSTHDEYASYQQVLDDMNKELSGHIMTNEIAVTEHLNPHRNYKMQQWLARNFGIRDTLAGILGKELSDVIATPILNPGKVVDSAVISAPGDVSKSLQRTAQFVAKAFDMGANTPEQLKDLAKIFKGDPRDFVSVAGISHTSTTIKQAYKDVIDVLAPYKLDRETIGRLWETAVNLNSTEVYIHKAKQISGMDSMRAHMLNAARGDNFYNELKAIGLNDAEINVLHASSRAVAVAHDEVIDLAHTLGGKIDPKVLDNYFASTLSNEALFTIARYDLSEIPYTRIGDKVDYDQLQEAINRSRLSADFVVEDEALLAYMLGKPLAEAHNLMTDTNDLTKALLDDLSEADLDFLITEGIVSKLPVPSVEVLKRIAERVEGRYGPMPFKGMSDFVITDPVKAYNVLKSKLRDMVVNNNTINSVFSDGVKGNWAITPEKKTANPSEYSSFKRIEPEMLAKHGLDINNIPGAKDMYVHPMVLEMLDGHLTIATSPAKLNTVARTVDYIFSATKSWLLATTGFVGRNVMQGALSSLMAGSDLTLVPGTFVKYMRYINSGDIKVFNNTKKIYAGLTERQLVESLMTRGTLDRFVPQTGDKISLLNGGLTPDKALTSNSWVGSSVGALRRAAYYAKNHQHFSLLDNIENLANGAAHVSSKYTGMYTGFSSHIENIYKLVNLKTTLNKNVVSEVRKLGTSLQAKGFDSLDDAVDHMHNYFFDYSNKGLMDTQIGKYVLPFWMWMSRNGASSIKHVARNPKWTMAYWRVYGMINEPMRDDEGLPEGGQGFEAANRPLYWRTPDGEYASISTRSIDSLGDFAEGTKEFAETIGRAIGLYVGTSKDKIDMLPYNKHSDKMNSLAASILEKSHPFIQAAANLSFNRDPDFGNQLDLNRKQSLLGVEVDPRLDVVLRNLIPALGQFDSLNPGYVLGRKEKIDPITGLVLVPGESGEMGGAKRTKKSSFDDDLLKEPFLWGFKALGGTIGTVEVARNVQQTEIYVSIVRGDYNDELKKVSRELVNESDSDKRAQLQAKRDEIIIVRDKLNTQLLQLQDWRERHGVPTANAIKRISNDNKMGRTPTEIPALPSPN